MSLQQAKLFIEKFFADESFRLRADEIIKLPLNDTAGRQAFLDREGLDCTEAEIKEVAQSTINEQFDPIQGWDEYYEWLFS